MAQRSYRSPSSAFARAMGRLPQRVGEVRVPIDTRQRSLPVEAFYHWWHPERDGVEHAPADFDRQLKLIHPDLAVCRAPGNVPAPCDSRWMVWVRKPEIRHYWCRGWNLLFLWPPKEFEPIPLDNRIFANLAIIDARKYSKGTDYFDTIVADLQRTKERQAKSADEYKDDRAADYWDATKIKNIGHGSKFALHHDGTVMPGRGEQNWLRERGKFLPKDVVDRDDAETARQGRKGTVATRVDQHAVMRNSVDRQLADLKLRHTIIELAKQRRREHVFVPAKRAER